MVSVINPSSTQHLSYYSSSPYASNDIMGNYSYGSQMFTNWSSSLFRAFPRQQQQQQSHEAYHLPPQNRSPCLSKDYSKPLFVDCSIEYELPNAPAIPKNSQPILMVHPGYKKPRGGHLKVKSPSNNSSYRLASATTAAAVVVPERKAAKRAYKEITPSTQVPLQGSTSYVNPSHTAAYQQQQQPSAQPIYCSCHPQVKRSRGFFYEQFIQEQQFLNYHRNAPYRLGGNRNWT